MKRIEKLWADFRRKVVPIAAPPVQVTEMRRAFYAGAGALFSELIRMLDPGTEPTEADLRKMDAIAMELEQFFAEVKAGKN